jgi:hypothetical protein
LEPHVIQGNYCKTTGSYFLGFLRLYVYRYLCYCLYVWSGINEILINYDRYLILSNKTNIFNRKHSFKIITSISCLLSFFFFVPNLFAYNISSFTNQTDSYYVSKSQFGNTSLFQLYLSFIVAVSNILSTIFLILASAKLVQQARHYSRSLVSLRTNLKHTANNRQEIRRKKLEINIFKLVITMSVLFTLVRLCDFAYIINNSLILFNMAYNCEFFVYYANLWYILGVIVLNSNIFVLCIFNSKFRHILFHYFRETFIRNSTVNTY